MNARQCCVPVVGSNHDASAFDDIDAKFHIGPTQVMAVATYLVGISSLMRVRVRASAPLKKLLASVDIFPNAGERGVGEAFWQAQVCH